MFARDEGATDRAPRLEYFKRLFPECYGSDINEYGFTKWIDLGKALIARNALQDQRAFHCGYKSSDAIQPLPHLKHLQLYFFVRYVDRFKWSYHIQ